MTFVDLDRLCDRLDIPSENRDWFKKAVQNATDIYRQLARPKGHPDGTAETARRMSRAGKAALSGDPTRIKSAVADLTAEQRERLEDLARAGTAGSGSVTDEDLAAAAVSGSRPILPWSARRRAKAGRPPPRTVGEQAGGRPARPEIDVLVSQLAAALAGATGKAATRGSKNLRHGALIPSALERLVTEVQADLGEAGQWNPIDRVRGHVAARAGKPPRQR